MKLRAGSYISELENVRRGQSHAHLAELTRRRISSSLRILDGELLNLGRVRNLTTTFSNSLASSSIRVTLPPFFNSRLHVNPILLRDAGLANCALFVTARLPDFVLLLGDLGLFA